jgi:glycosyltransferase involved in cell wall biosynthesis
MISCLTVTRPGRLESLRRAIVCFEAQSFSDRELVIVHDGDTEFAADLGSVVHGVEGEINVVAAESGQSLGRLRNISVEAAAGDIVCQWDDDDLYHPLRLEVQHQALASRDGSACLLVDQLHLFDTDSELYWDDWSSELFPMSLIQGTLMAAKADLALYPDLERGEDTPVVVALVNSGHRVVPLQDHGFLYVYVYDGLNAWGEQHHREISEVKARRGPFLQAGIEELTARLAEYPLPARTVQLIDGESRIDLTLGGGG